MKYFEKLAKEDSAIPELLGGATTGGVMALRVKSKKGEIAGKIKEQYKARRVSSKAKGAAEFNKMTRTALKGGAKAGIGLAVGGAAAVGAGITHLLD